ncbi:MAG: DNA repair protein RecN [Alphaproteobacteria bacterium]|nr:MAG: DNA repair protein RecN [Alphaproteobacteria bacterium]
MLKNIYIKNIVLIDEIKIDINSGLNVFTGETGAGKSILLGGLGLALGSRANFSLIGNNEDLAIVTANFILKDDHPVKKFLITKNIEFENNLVLKRTISNKGVSKAYINNSPVSLNELNQIGQSLVEVQGQFDNHTLLNSLNHINFLDQFGNYQPQKNNTKLKYERMLEAKKKLSEFKLNYENYEKELELNKSILNELEDIKPLQNEENELVERRSLISNSTKIVNAVNDALGKLNGEDSVIKRINNILNSLEKTNFTKNQQINEIIETLLRASNELEESNGLLQHFQNTLNTDPQELDNIDSRLYKIRNLSRKINCEPNLLYEFYIELKNKIQNSNSKDNSIDILERDFTNKYNEYKESCFDLRNTRISTAIQLDEKINNELPHLKLETANFKTVIREKIESEWNENGADEIIFYITTNPKQELMPLSKTVSGGELSRFLLAIKVVLASSNQSNTLIFDEVDSGVGGKTADAVGLRLLNLSLSNQVVVITHSPQVAAKGQNHFLIEKINNNDKLTTTCNSIPPSERINEIARMLSGETITEEAKAAAMKLLNG